MPKIYTKVGDKGQTSLVGGQKVAKNDGRLEAYGTIDELNCAIGLVRVWIDEASHQRAPLHRKAVPIDSAFDSLMRMSADLESIQNWLFDLGGLLASQPQDRAKFSLAPVPTSNIEMLEDRIDGATTVLEPLKNFILPGGTEAAARLHLARTIARRAERHMVAMGDECPENAIPFVNRLSDYLFVMARLCNHLVGVSDVLWTKSNP